MRELKSTCRVAVVQATPVMFDKSKCLEKALRLIDESADNGAELIVFHPRLSLRHDLRLHRRQPQGHRPRGLENVL